MSSRVKAYFNKLCRQLIVNSNSKNIHFIMKHFLRMKQVSEQSRTCNVQGCPGILYNHLQSCDDQHFQFQWTSPGAHGLCGVHVVLPVMR